MRKKTKAERKEKQMHALFGKGRYLYRTKNSDVILPKPDAKGRKFIPANSTFEGDDYFMFLVKNHTIFLADTLDSGIIKEEKEPLMEQKLLLDQPDQVTQIGTVENVVIRQEEKKITEKKTQLADGNILITDDAMSGIEIILD